MTRFISLLFAALFLLALPVLAQFNEPDYKLNAWVTDGNVISNLVSGNTMYIGGSFSHIGPNTGGGSPLSLSTGKIEGTALGILGTVYTSISDGNGGWYIGGQFSFIGTTSSQNLAHILSDFSLDPSWDVNVNSNVNSLALSGNTLYVGGSFSTVKGEARQALAAVDVTTRTVTSWNPGSNNVVNTLAVSGSLVYAGGGFTTIGGQSRNRIAALDIFSGAATSWNPGSGGTVNAIIVSGSTVYVGGSFTTIGGQSRNRIAALDASSGNATSWDPSSNNVVNALFLNGSTMYVGGSFGTIGGQPRNGIAAIDIGSGLATSWDPNSNGTVSTITRSGNTVYVGGTFTTIGSQVRNRIAALDATTGTPTSWDPNASITYVTLNSSIVNTLALSGGRIYAGGSFTSIGGVTRSGLAAIDLTTGTPTNWDPSVSGTVRTMALNGSTLYVGGSFTSIDGTTRNRIAALEVSTGVVTSWNPNSDGIVNSLALDGNIIYVGGAFNAVGGKIRSRIAAVDITTGAATNWNPNSGGTVQTILVQGNVVYAGGSFSTIGGATRSNIAALDPTTGTATSWNPNANNFVNTMKIGGNIMYVGGNFSSIGGQSRNRIAALDLSTGTAKSWNPNSDNQVSGLDFGNGAVYIGGNFNTVGSLSRSRLAAIDSITGSVTDWNPGVTGTVALVSLIGNTVYASGNYSAVGSQVRTRFVGLSTSINCTPPATPTITASGPTTFCTGGSVTLSAPAGFSYLWSNGATTQSINATTAGSYTVQVIDNGCTSSTSAATVVTVNPTPSTPSITASGPTTFCTGGSVTLSAPAGFSYLWSNGATTQSINATTAGSYTVQVIDNGCTSSISAATMVTVNAAPSTPSITASGPTTFCTGGSVTLSAPAGFSYLWSNGATTQSINATTAGSYTVQVIDNGCTSSISAATVVTVNPTPSTPSITASGPTTFCTGGSVTLSAPAGFSYLWSNGATTQSINATTAGSYTVQVIDNGCTSSISAATVVTVNAIPGTPSITAGGPTTFTTGGSVTLTAPAGFSYIWSTNETTQSIVVNTSGSYTVRTISTGCTSAVSAATVITVTPASSNVWIWTGSDDYTNTANWNKGTLPDPGADSVIIQSGTCTVTAPVSFTRLYVAAGATLNLVQTDLSINTQLNVAGTLTGTDQTSITFGTGGTVLGSGTIQVNSLKLPAGQLLIYAALKVKEVDATGQLVLRTPGELRYVTGHTHTSHWVHNASQSMVMDNPDQFVMEMHLDPSNAIATGAWYNVGPPIQNYRVGNLEQGFSFAAGTYNNAIPTSSSLYLYDPTDNTWPTNVGYVKAANANQTLTDQQGVRLWLTQARIAAGPIEFKGNPFLTLPLTYNLSYCASGCSYGSPNGFNLVKNPLLTGLNFGDQAKTPRTNLSNSLWIWRQSLGNFASYNGGVGVNGGTDIVKPGQAFFVQATAPGATLQITYDSGEQEDGSIFRRPAVDNVIKLKLSQGTRAIDETAIRFLPQATTAYDAAYDAAKMMGTSTSISSVMDNQRYAINALPLSGTTRIPLHLSAAIASHSISIETEALAQGTTLYLNHPSMSQPMLVQQGTTVQVQAGWDTGLELIVVPASITALPGQLNPTLTLIPNPATTAVQLHMSGASITGVEVLDQLGRTVLTTTTLPNQTLDISTLAAGSYLVKASTAQGVVTKRLAVIR